MMNNNLTKIFKALSSEQRLNIFTLLYEWQHSSDSTSDYPNLEDVMERCFTKVCCCTNLSRSTISHHFKELENAGLITCTRNGQSFICRINMEALEAVRNFLK